MTCRPVALIAVAAGVLGGLAPEGLAAQSTYSGRGLGYPIEARDARAQGLGGVGLGLPGSEISWANPAATIGLVAPAFVMGYQFDSFSATGSGTDVEGRSARFPLVMGAFTAGQRLVFTVGYGSFLDQNWRVEQPDTLNLFGDTVPIIDVASSIGGVARLRLGGAYEVLEGVGLGLGLDVYTGSVDRQQGRRFPGEAAPGCCRAGWSYGGMGLTAGVHWNPTEDNAVALSLSYGGELEATPMDTLGAAEVYQLPLTARIGGSGRLGQNALVALSGSWSGWSALQDALAPRGGAQDVWSVEGGLEWDGLLVRERPVPLRVGARTAALPFRWSDAPGVEWPSERALTFGTGVVFAGGATRTDLALELGNRGGEAAAVDESYWRLAFSVRVLSR